MLSFSVLWFVERVEEWINFFSLVGGIVITSLSLFTVLPIPVILHAVYRSGTTTSLLWAAWGIWGLVRAYRRDGTLVGDLVVWSVAVGWLMKEKIVATVPEVKATLDANPELARSCFLTLGWVLMGTFRLTVLGSNGAKEQQNYGPATQLSEPHTKDVGVKGKTIKRPAPEHLKPYMFPCWTSHTRLYPKTHSFGYSYLMVGVPVSRESNQEVLKLGWCMQVRAQDYLEKGGEGAGFWEKLKQCLQNKGIDEDQWSHAYLVTAPRFLGYSFNPVSFWYIYSSDHELKYMILEVNNVSEERHLYLLHGSKSQEDASAKLTKIFKDEWAKEMHVSPFSSRNGSYTLKLDPVFQDTTAPKIKNLITLKGSHGKTKLVGRVWSTGAAVAPADLSAYEWTKFVASWWWVGFMTLPRTIKEAAALLYRRRLSVWSRPEVKSSSVGRCATKTEMILQSFFERQLKQLVASSPVPLQVTYEDPSLPSGKSRQTFCTPNAGEGTFTNITLRISSPVFYTRLLNYTNTADALYYEGIITNEMNRTVTISDSGLLSLLRNRKPDESENERMGWLDNLRWDILRRVRCPPASPNYPDVEGNTGEKEKNLGLSELDHFVMYNCPPLDGYMYRKSVMRHFLSQRLAFGHEEVLTFLDFLTRIILGIFGATILLWNIKEGKKGLKPDSVVEAAAVVATAWGTHVYGLLKDLL